MENKKENVIWKRHKHKGKSKESRDGLHSAWQQDPVLISKDVPAWLRS